MIYTNITDKISMNKILIVTSKVTFVPMNYANLFVEFIRLRNEDPDFKAKYKIKVVFLDNRSPMLFLKAFSLILFGAPRIGGNLFINALRSYFWDSRIKLLHTNDIETFEFKSPNTLLFRNFLRQEKIDLLINARTRYIYKRKTLHTPKLGAFNIHHGILPDNRGTMCDLWAMYQNRPLGFSLHQMNEKIDDGKIITVYEHQQDDFKNLKNYSTYLEKTSTIEGKVLFEFIKHQFPIIEHNGIESIGKKRSPIEITLSFL